MAQELIYTSAPRGLKPSSSGFCTVAYTRGIPMNLVDLLESLSAYKTEFPAYDPNAFLNPVSYSHYRFTIGSQTFNVLSRICFAGFDYSKRSNKLAHHIVLDARERTMSGPASLLMTPSVFTKEWGEREPQIFENPPLIPKIQKSLTPAKEWEKLTGDAGWAGVLAEAFLKSPETPAYIVFKPGIELLPLFEEAMLLIPEDQRWKVSFNTYFTMLPQGVKCIWRGCLPEESEFKKAKRISGTLIIDLTTDLGRASGGELVTAARTGLLEKKIPSEEMEKDLQRVEKDNIPENEIVTPPPDNEQKRLTPQLSRSPLKMKKNDDSFAPPRPPDNMVSYGKTKDSTNRNSLIDGGGKASELESLKKKFALAVAGLIILGTVILWVFFHGGFPKEKGGEDPSLELDNTNPVNPEGSNSQNNQDIKKQNDKKLEKELAAEKEKKEKEAAKAKNVMDEAARAQEKKDKEATGKAEVVKKAEMDAAEKEKKAKEAAEAKKVNDEAANKQTQKDEEIKNMFFFHWKTDILDKLNDQNEERRVAVPLPSNIKKDYKIIEITFNEGLTSPYFYKKDKPTLISQSTNSMEDSREPFLTLSLEDRKLIVDIKITPEVDKENTKKVIEKIKSIVISSTDSTPKTEEYLTKYQDQKLPNGEGTFSSSEFKITFNYKYDEIDKCIISQDRNGEKKGKETVATDEKKDKGGQGKKEFDPAFEFAGVGMKTNSSNDNKVGITVDVLDLPVDGSKSDDGLIKLIKEYQQAGNGNKELDTIKIEYNGIKENGINSIKEKQGKVMQNIEKYLNPELIKKLSARLSLSCPKNESEESIKAFQKKVKSMVKTCDEIISENKKDNEKNKAESDTKKHLKTPQEQASEQKTIKSIEVKISNLEEIKNNLVTLDKEAEAFNTSIKECSNKKEKSKNNFEKGLTQPGEILKKIDSDWISKNFKLHFKRNSKIIKDIHFSESPDKTSK